MIATKYTKGTMLRNRFFIQLGKFLYLVYISAIEL
jgi:hypothetical protein